MATLEEITRRIRDATASGVDLGRSVKLDLKGEGFIHIDGASVTNADAPADLIVRISHRDLEVMTGRMKLSDMGLAMQLAPGIQALFSKAV
jgi:putative sterol carrier protein